MFSTMIGNKIKVARIHKGFSREQVARKLGIKAQQIHKYEIGINNISAEKIASIAKILNKPINYFFE